MKINLRFFASIREAIGHASEPLETDARNLRELRDELIARGGAYAESLAPGRAVRMALNHQMCDDGTALVEGCEAAFFPPVTGG